LNWHTTVEKRLNKKTKKQQLKQAQTEREESHRPECRMARNKDNPSNRVVEELRWREDRRTDAAECAEMQR
jgi:hypothetical protein